MKTIHAAIAVALLAGTAMATPSFAQPAAPSTPPSTTTSPSSPTAGTTDSTASTDKKKDDTKKPAGN